MTTDTIGANNQYGWTCARCGAWVAAGQYHTCQQAQWSSYTPDYTAMLERLVVALERIADRLDVQHISNLRYRIGGEMSKSVFGQKGPMKRTIITYLRLGCEYCKRDVETNRVGGGWSSFNFCDHPSYDGHRRLIGENKDVAPTWCPEMNL